MIESDLSLMSARRTRAVSSTSSFELDCVSAVVAPAERSRTFIPELSGVKADALCAKAFEHATDSTSNTARTIEGLFIPISPMNRIPDSTQRSPSFQRVYASRFGLKSDDQGFSAPPMFTKGAVVVP